MKNLEDITNNELLSIYEEMIEENHYSPLVSKTFDYNFKEIKKEVILRMDNGLILENRDLKE